MHFHIDYDLKGKAHMALDVDIPLAPSITEPTCSKGSILVVDDEPAICVVMGIILKLHGYAVFRAHSVPQAISYLQANRPDLILVDIMMPGVDGITMIRNIKSTPEWAEIPTIVLSAKTGQQDRQEAYEAGASAFLAKPFTANELHGIVEPFLNDGC
jgi:CheY-like chemotaxis protein